MEINKIKKLKLKKVMKAMVISTIIKSHKKLMVIIKVVTGKS